MIFKRNKKLKEKIEEKDERIEKLVDQVQELVDQRYQYKHLNETLERTIKAKDAYIFQLEKNDAARLPDRGEVT